MATVNTNDLRIKNSENFIASLNEGTTADAYVFVGRVQPWADENAPPPPQNNNQAFYDAWDNMFSMKRVNDVDANHIIPRYSWNSGELYDRYQQNYTPVNKSASGASNLYDARFIVINRLNYVYVCLDNNNNSVSTVEPMDAGDFPFSTSDGYQWLRLYNIPSVDMDAKASNNFIPITTSADSNFVVRDAGEVYTIIIEDGGAGYTVNPAGVSNQVDEYYVKIDGDGTGGVAKVTVAEESVRKVEVVRYGQDYSFASINFSVNNVYENLADLDNATNALNPLGNGAFRSTVIISPPGGWGSDLVRQLGGTRVAIYSNLNYDNFKNFIPASFRQVGIMQDFTYNQTNPDSIQTCLAIKTTALPEGESLIVGQEIRQIVQVAQNTIGEIRYVTKIARGFVIGWDSTNNVVRYTQSSANADDDGNLYSFGGDSVITQGNFTITPVTTYTAEDENGLYFLNGYSVPQATKYTGLMTYIANISPVVQDPDQSERINLVISF